MTMSDDPDKTVERTDVGVSITTTITRGSGTRDQDKHKIKSKGKTVDDALEKHERAVQWVEDEFAQRVRDLQPEVEEDDDE
jgi:hypothetical protein